MTTQITRLASRCHASSTCPFPAPSVQQQVPCLIALVTSSVAMITASVASSSRSQSCSVAVVNSRAIFADSGPELSSTRQCPCAAAGPGVPRSARSPAQSGGTRLGGRVSSRA
ncbi:MAG TPA: hypothetical protein VLX31_17590 [Streptosporangiaceae bacterium]|nr:hypothetical protein [Streptosporangiaceae bacterium]